MRVATKVCAYHYGYMAGLAAIENKADPWPDGLVIPSEHIEAYYDGYHAALKTGPAWPERI